MAVCIWNIELPMLGHTRIGDDRSCVIVNAQTFIQRLSANIQADVRMQYKGKNFFTKRQDIRVRSAVLHTGITDRQTACKEALYDFHNHFRK